MKAKRGLKRFAILVAGVSVHAHAARPTILQTVDLTDKDMSLEGGEATLSRVTEGKHAYCRIAVVHYGETGKTTLGFAFKSRLFSAVRREYRYDRSIYGKSDPKVSLTRQETLATKAGAKDLPEEFKLYRNFFDPRKLSACGLSR